MLSTTGLKRVKLINLVRVRPSEDEFWVDTFRYSGEKDQEQAIRDAVREYLFTKEGKKAAADTNWDFNWGDAIMLVPDEIWAKHGLSLVREDATGIRVNQDEVLCGGRESE